MATHKVMVATPAFWEEVLPVEVKVNARGGKFCRKYGTTYTISSIELQRAESI